jgi:superfamily II DNA helicase RecQ
MMLSQWFINNILRKPTLHDRVHAIIIDEAHCISHWGAAFHKKYGSLGVARAFLPKSTPVIAVSASLTQRVSRDITQKLQFQTGYIYRNLGNDRPNVSIIVRAIHNPLHSYSDLNFLIPMETDIRHGADIKKTWIYADNIEVGAEIIDYLHTLLPKHLQDIVCPYNAVHSIDYRTVAMDQFRAGRIRILVCTDAAGMVCCMSIQAVPQLNAFGDRVVTSLTSISLFNGSYLRNSQASFSVRAMQLEVQILSALLCFL